VSGGVTSTALDWCDHVDGVTIFPKLPAYLRTHHTAWQRNENTRKAVAAAASGEAELDRINAETLQQLLPTQAAGAPALAAVPAAAVAAAAAASVRGGAANAGPAPQATAAAGEAARGFWAAGASGLPVMPFASSSRSFLPLAQHPPLPPAVFPTGESPVIAAGLRFGPAPPVRGEKRGNEQRGAGKKPRAQRRCKTCLEKLRGDEEARACAGRWPNSRACCPHASE